MHRNSEFSDVQCSSIVCIRQCPDVSTLFKPPKLQTHKKLSKSSEICRKVPYLSEDFIGKSRPKKNRPGLFSFKKTILSPRISEHIPIPFFLYCTKWRDSIRHHRRTRRLWSRRSRQWNLDTLK